MVNSQIIAALTRKHNFGVLEALIHVLVLNFEEMQSKKGKSFLWEGCVWTKAYWASRSKGAVSFLSLLRKVNTASAVPEHLSETND